MMFLKRTIHFCKMNQNKYYHLTTQCCVSVLHTEFAFVYAIRKEDSTAATKESEAVPSFSRESLHETIVRRSKLRFPTKFKRQML